MIRDAQGLALAGATAEAADHFDRGVRAYALSYGDAASSFEAARRAAPGCAMAHLGKAYVLGLANDAILVKQARSLLAEANGLELGARERVHAAALAHAVEGRRGPAVDILDRHLMEHPHDLLAHFAALILDAFQGRFHCVRDRAARALPRWSRDQAGYGVLLSLYGFGLEEAGNYEKSESVSRQAAELEPYGYWAHHAVSHVMEMTGRPQDGLAWMDAREAFWSGPQNTSRVHIWWHKALFHMELGDHAAALAIYDGPIQETQRPVGISLTNATALLWRLETLGIDAGDRWNTLADLWRGHADGRLCLFADIHAAMTAIRAGDGAERDKLVAAMQETARMSGEVGLAYRDVGLPIVAGLQAFHEREYGAASEHLLAARRDLWRIGGSHAQRDLIDWTLAEAAIRAGRKSTALALAHERLALRPASAPNRRFLEAAERIAA